MRKYIDLITESQDLTQEGAITNGIIGAAALGAVGMGAHINSNTPDFPRSYSAQYKYNPSSANQIAIIDGAGIVLKKHNGRDFIYFKNGTNPQGTFTLNGKTYSVGPVTTGTPSGNLVSSVMPQYTFIGWNNLSNGGIVKVGDQLVAIKQIQNAASQASESVPTIEK